MGHTSTNDGTAVNSMTDLMVKQYQFMEIDNAKGTVAAIQHHQGQWRYHRGGEI